MMKGIPPLSLLSLFLILLLCGGGSVGGVDAHKSVGNGVGSNGDDDHSSSSSSSQQQQPQPHRRGSVSSIVRGQGNGKHNGNNYSSSLSLSSSTQRVLFEPKDVQVQVGVGSSSSSSNGKGGGSSPANPKKKTRKYTHKKKVGTEKKRKKNDDKTDTKQALIVIGGGDGDGDEASSSASASASTSSASSSSSSAPTFQILSCDEETVVVDIATTGADGDNDDDDNDNILDQLLEADFLLYLSMDASMVCTTPCNPLYRKIHSISMDSDTDTDTTTTNTIVTLKTSLATFGEIYSGADDEIANDTIEQSIGCDDVRKERKRRNLLDLSTTTNNNVHQKVVESFTTLVVEGSSNHALVNDAPNRRLEAKFPSTCSEWLQTNADGTCVYTDCYITPIADGSRPADRCYFCWKDVCDNGCGKAGSVVLNTDGDFGAFDFGEACCIHDYCYSSIFNRDQCDTEFLRDMMDQCRALLDLELPVIPYGLIIVPMKVVRNIGQACVSFAHGFHAAVRRLGGAGANRDARLAQKTYESGFGPPNNDGDCSGCCPFGMACCDKECIEEERYCVETGECCPEGLVCCDNDCVEPKRVCDTDTCCPVGFECCPYASGGCQEEDFKCGCYDGTQLICCGDEVPSLWPIDPGCPCGQGGFWCPGPTTCCEATGVCLGDGQPCDDDDDDGDGNGGGPDKNKPTKPPGDDSGGGGGGPGGGSGGVGDRCSGCSSASSFGDPHLRTFDSIDYSCQATGDFVLFQVPSGPVAHVRYKNPDFSSRVSLTSGFAVHIEGTTVEAVINEESLDLELFVNGDVKEDQFFANDHVRASIYGNLVRIRFVSSVIDITARVQLEETENRHFNVRVEVPPSFEAKGSMSGLLGSPDGDRTNDWQTRDGDNLPVPSKSDRLGQAGYDYCTQNWQLVSPDDSLFSTEPSCLTLNGCVVSYPGDVDVSQASEEIEALCGSDVACIIDGIGLGPEGSRSYLNSSALFASSASSLQAQPSNLIAGKSTLVTFTVNFNASFVDYESFLAWDNSCGFQDYFSLDVVDPDTLEKLDLYETLYDFTYPFDEPYQKSDDGQYSMRDSGYDGCGRVWCFSFDNVAGDMTFTTVLPIRIDLPGKELAFLASPRYNPTDVCKLPFDIVNFNAVRSFSEESGLGEQVSMLGVSQAEQMEADGEYTSTLWQKEKTDSIVQITGQIPEEGYLVLETKYSTLAYDKGYPIATCTDSDDTTGTFGNWGKFYLYPRSLGTTGNWVVNLYLVVPPTIATPPAVMLTVQFYLYRKNYDDNGYVYDQGEFVSIAVDPVYLDFEFSWFRGCDYNDPICNSEPIAQLSIEQSLDGTVAVTVTPKSLL